MINKIISMYQTFPATRYTVLLLPITYPILSLILGRHNRK